MYNSYFNYSTTSLTLPVFFNSKEMEKSLIKVKGKQPIVDEGHIYKGITIEPSKESRAQKVILEKLTMKMTKHIQCQIYKGSHTRGSLI